MGEIAILVELRLLVKQTQCLGVVYGAGCCVLPELSCAELPVEKNETVSEFYSPICAGYTGT